MATLQEEQSVLTQAQAPTALRQEIDMVAPVMQTGTVNGSIPSTSHDIQSVTSKLETAVSMTEKWKLLANYIIDKSTTTDKEIDYFDVGVGLTNHIPVPYLVDHTGDGGIYSNSYVRFDTQFKFTIYSSSQQQGALIFAMFPFNRDTVTHLAKECAVSDAMVAKDLTQFQHRIISLGRDTEYIMTVPYMSKYTITPVSETSAWAHIKFYVFDQLQCLENTFDKVHLKVECRMINLSVEGPKFRDGFKYTVYGI